MGVARGLASRVARPREALARRGLSGERGALLSLCSFAVLVHVGVVAGSTHILPLAAQVVPIVLGNLLLGERALRYLLALIGVLAALTLLELGVASTRVGSLVVLVLTAAIVYRTAAGRSRLGMTGVRGDVVLADLRDRLAPGSAVPALRDGWHADAGSRLAGGLAFGGDFVVTAQGEDTVQLALVDVSGSGLAAATRALQLSGAFGALLGAVHPPSFLAAANAYVLRQDWEDGFATAVHLTLDTRSGEYALRSAGHPPAAQFRAQDGAWSLSRSAGPALGLLPDAAYGAEQGRLDRGDALLIYTDGLVEVAGQELEAGINRLLGMATTLVVDGFRGGALRLIDGIGDATGDDRAAVLIWRD